MVDKSSGKGFQGFDPDEEEDYIDFGEVDDANDKHIPKDQNKHKSDDILMIEDLAKSGLDRNDMDVKVMSNEMATSIKVPGTVKGYVINYKGIHGQGTYYRCRLFDHEPKYKQMKNTPNHLYFPRGFLELYNKTGKKYVVLVEGEKKAALLHKHGIPAVGLSGVDSWRNRYVQIPSAFEQIAGEKKGFLTFKATDASWDPETYSGTATGFEDLCNLLYRDQSMIIMSYDADREGSKAFYNCQRAAAQLGFELRTRGLQLTNIRQVLLPNNTPEKIGVDDYIMAKSVDDYKLLLNATIQAETAFPHFPNIREYIAKQLGKPRLGRKQYQQIGISLLSDLDRRGKRMYSPDEDQLYYFNRDNKHLMKVKINEDMGSAINSTEFGRLLYKDYDISATADRTIVQWLGTQLAAESPIEDVSPARIIARPRPLEDAVRFQINDGQFVKVTGDTKKPFQVLNNGDDHTLFVSDGSFPLNGEDLQKELQKQIAKPLKPWWFDVMENVKLKEHGESARAMALLYYISPWLYRWRGTQLPVEMVCGESGSGKSTLVSLRLNILTGQASLKNAPNDLKDWYSTLSKSGGMHVTDNLHFTDKQLAQRMSDEICRLVTEPNPTIEQRKLFTDNEVFKMPIDAIFSFTAIKQPFNNADLIQRSFILELDKTQSLASDLKDKDYAFDSYWLQHQLERFGGRTAWVAHHLLVLHKFFALLEERWNEKYKAKYRLINLEQCMLLMAEVFGMDGSWIPDFLATTTNKIISKSDWVLEGLKSFADFHRAKAMSNDWEFPASQISTWCDANEEYEDNQVLTNARSLGRYLQTAKYNIATIAGIIEGKKVGNKQHYRITKKG